MVVEVVVVVIYLLTYCVLTAGQLKTTARWIRDFVAEHPSYQRDSVVSEPVCYDLVSACAEITNGTRDEPMLIFDHKSRTAANLPAAMQRNDQHLANMAAKRAVVGVAADGIGDGPLPQSS